MHLTEFQAVVMAGGRGSRLSEIGGDRPKCLLNVGPFPMIFYPLHFLQQYFSDVLVVVLEGQRNEIQQRLEKTGLKIRIEFVTIPSDSDFGTAESLKYISDRVRKDILVMSCDMITDFKLQPLLNAFRQHNASMVSLLLPGGQEKGAVVPGLKSKYKPERDLIGVHPETNRLLFMGAMNDFEDQLKLPGHLLRKHERLIVNSQLLDGHVYVMRKWIVDFLANSKSFISLKGELIPYIIRKQMSRPKVAKDCDRMVSEAKVDVNDDDIFNFAGHSDLEKRITRTSLFNDSLSTQPYHSDIITCYAIVARRDTLGFRTNNMTSFWAANKRIIAEWPRLFGGTQYSLVSPLATVNCTQMLNCAVSDGASIAEKTSLKNSVIGHQAVIGTKTRISDSVIMNNVTVEEGVVIENCIIGDKAVIKKGTFLKLCLVGPEFEVPEGSSHEKKHLGGWNVFT